MGSRGRYEQSLAQPLRTLLRGECALAFSFFLCLDFLVEVRLVRKRPFDEIRILAFGRGSQALYGCLDGGRKAAYGYDT